MNLTQFSNSIPPLQPITELTTVQSSLLTGPTENSAQSNTMPIATALDESVPSTARTAEDMAASKLTSSSTSTIGSAATVAGTDVTAKPLSKKVSTAINYDIIDTILVDNDHKHNQSQQYRFMASRSSSDNAALNEKLKNVHIKSSMKHRSGGRVDVAKLKSTGKHRHRSYKKEKVSYNNQAHLLYIAFRFFVLI